MAVRVKLTREQERLLQELRAELVGINASLWAPKLAHCLTLLVEDRLLAGATCFSLLVGELVIYPSVRDLAIRLYESLFGGKPIMPCVTTHRTSGKVQGPGLCCSQVGVAGGLVAPPAGTTLPQYLAGQADAGQIPAGRIVGVTTATGKCGSCMVVGSSSKKHLGKPVLKFIPGGPTCPTAGTGCCAL
jgi:hypothetical protein